MKYFNLRFLIVIYIYICFFALFICGCMPLTFTNKSVIDYTIYNSLYIAPIHISDTDGYYGNEGYFSDDYTNYLINEMKLKSGFEKITKKSEESIDLILRINVKIVTNYDEEDNSDEYRAIADIQAVLPNDKVILRKSIEDESSFEDEAIEDVLDEISHYFMPSYRI